MAFDFASGISLASSLAGGGLFGGGSKAGERAAKDAAARQMYAAELAQTTARKDTEPYRNIGGAAADQLMYELGLGSGALNLEKPTYDSVYEELRSNHFNYFGKDYNRNSNVAGQRMLADKIYKERLGEWQKKADEYKATQGGVDKNFGGLTRGFTEDDLNNDVVYNKGLQFGLDTGLGEIKAQARARGGLQSGALLKELTKYGNDYGETKAGGAFDRFNINRTNKYNMLSGAAGIGSGATNTAIQSGLTTTGMTNNALANQANIGIAGQAASNQRRANVFNTLAGVDWNSVLSSGRTPPYVPDRNWSYSG